MCLFACLCCTALAPPPAIAQGHLAFRLLSISFNDAMSLAMIMMPLLLPVLLSLPTACVCLCISLWLCLCHCLRQLCHKCRPPSCISFAAASSSCHSGLRLIKTTSDLSYTMNSLCAEFHEADLSKCFFTLCLHCSYLNQEKIVIDFTLQVAISPLYISPRLGGFV